MSRAYNTHNFTLPVFCRLAVDGHAIYPSTTSSTFDMNQLVRIYRHCRKERLKITKLAKFESDMSETSEDIAPQNANVYRRLYGGGGGGGGTQTCPHHTNVYKIFSTLRSHIFVWFHPITLKLDNSTDFKALFPVVSMDFR